MVKVRVSTPSAPCRNLTAGHEAAQPSSPSASASQRGFPTPGSIAEGKDHQAEEATFTNGAPVNTSLLLLLLLRNLRGAVIDVDLPSDLSAASRIFTCRAGGGDGRHFIVSAECVREEHPGFTLVLDRVLSEAGVAHVYAAIPFCCWPEQVKLGYPTYTDHPDTACRAVERMLRRGTRVTVETRFANESHARRAVAGLDNKDLPTTEDLKMTAQLVTSAAFEIEEDRVVANNNNNTLQRYLDRQAKVWEAELVAVLSRRQDGYILLELQGPDGQAVARAKAALERILEGELLSLREDAATTSLANSRQTVTTPVPGPVVAADTAESDSSDCPVCLTPAEGAIHTSCGHVYCATCFVAVCSPAALSPSASAITCIGNGATCGVAFPLAELQSLLPPATVEGILAAFATGHACYNHLVGCCIFKYHRSPTLTIPPSKIAASIVELVT
ncbi:uncharacterized protein B0T15DRAFT_557701 [Chaetomium strumarium]|uniref:RING-type domain-containing protein n=1 Tax=Chaetomium strumarium TaxID=1170767 RepID=A0AAJ0GQC4_9PEZI|nr:hypothetical protein B0T15DRAFT_557701 [Chaetomium strumarium]